MRGSLPCTPTFPRGERRGQSLPCRGQSEANPTQHAGHLPRWDGHFMLLQGLRTGEGSSPSTLEIPKFRTWARTRPLAPRWSTPPPCRPREQDARGVANTCAVWPIPAVSEPGPTWSYQPAEAPNRTIPQGFFLRCWANDLCPTVPRSEKGMLILSTSHNCPKGQGLRRSLAT